MQAGPGLKLLFSYYNYFLFCFTGVIFSIPIMIFKCFNVSFYVNSEYDRTM